ncbi:MAG: hypothetical protein FJ087_16495, partial [Deltaproteobacteria bacterium]|nr:hypothetical protein [Deltaproteobacteria bacterium]
MDAQTDNDAHAGPGRFSLRAVLAETIDALSRDARESRVEITAHVPDWVPDALAGDRAGLSRILAGVVGLGITDTPGGVVSLDVATASETGGRVVLRFSVTDTGAGAPDDGRRQGVAALVGAMGGRLSIESAAGVGSTVQFTLPLVLAGAVTKTAATNAGGVGMDERSGTGTGSGSGSGSSTDGKAPGGIRRGPLWGAALAAYGVGAAAYLLYAKIRIKFDASFASACDFGGKLNCDAVQTSPYSEVLGVPVALLAIPTYVMMAYLAVAAARNRDAAPEAAGRSVGALFGLGALTTGYAVYLAWLSAFVIKAFCIF